MARQLQSSFTGTIGNLTFYKLYNQYYVRTKSAGGVQTEATKACQKPFAMASAIAAAIRRILHPAIPYPAGKEMQNRLVKAVLQWLRSALPATTQPPASLSDIQGFQFVSQTNLRQRLLIDIHVLLSPGNDLIVHIPAFIPRQHIIAPQGAKEVQLCIASGSYNSSERNIASAHSIILNIPYTHKTIAEQTIILPVKAAPRHITVTAVAITYKIKQPASPALITVQQHHWKASAIIDFRYIQSLSHSSL